MKKGEFMESTVTPQDVIKTFMSSLDQTTLSAKAAMDEAIRACSNFTSMQDAINHFISDAQNAKNAETFLKDYCGIILNNKDTGAITGSDAGGSTVKTATSVVPESGSLAYPSGTSFTKRGLTVIIPEETELTSSQYTIVKGLNSWWIAEALKLNEESYDLSFNEDDVYVDEITLKFEDSEDSDALAYVSSSFDEETSLADELELVVNMKYYDDISASDVNGESSDEDAGYLDRTIAHEFTHALMAANISCYSDLPIFVLEGLAELTHGIDDERGDEILELAENPSQFSKYLKINRVDDESETYDYSSGYMFFRYLAKQASDSDVEDDMPTGLTYNSSYTVLTADSTFTDDEIDLSEYESSVKTVNASKATSAVNIIGNAKSNLLKGGKGADTLNGGKGNDTLTGGSGNDVFIYTSGQGNDIITDYTAKQDKIKLTSGTINTSSLNGSDVVLKVGTGSITVKNGKNKSITLVDSKGKTTSKIYGSTTTTSTTTLNVTNTNAATVTANSTVKVINASTRTKAVKITGNALANTILGGKGADTLIGGKGSDTLTGGTGNDVFVYASGDGNDVITDYTAKQDKIKLTSGTINSSSIKGSDVVLKVGTGSITIKNGKNKSITVVDTAGKSTSKVYGTSSRNFVEETWFTENDRVITDEVNDIMNSESNVVADTYKLENSMIDFNKDVQLISNSSKNLGKNK